MDNECAFCGCAIFKVKQVFCEDCASIHHVCQSCAREVAEGLEGYHLVA
jgi:hypothetical protein